MLESHCLKVFVRTVYIYIVPVLNVPEMWNQCDCSVSKISTDSS